MDAGLRFCGPGSVVFNIDGVFVGSGPVLGCVEDIPSISRGAVIFLNSNSGKWLRIQGRIP